jgi:hypothetical protein
MKTNFLTKIYIGFRAATAGKAMKDWSFPRFWNTLNLSQPGGPDQAHPIVLVLPWLKLAVAALGLVYSTVVYAQRILNELYTVVFMETKATKQRQ